MTSTPKTRTFLCSVELFHIVVVFVVFVRSSCRKVLLQSKASDYDEIERVYQDGNLSVFYANKLVSHRNYDIDNASHC